MLSTVHPHAGGEYVLVAVVEDVVHGSPPRRWGIPLPIDQVGPPHRFTPTQVGNTLMARPWYDFATVHPHAGGEYAGIDGEGFRGLGSPPRRWGIHDALHDVFARPRFTPTQVGNTPE